MYVVGEIKEGNLRILSLKLASGLTSKTVTVRSIWVTRQLDHSAFLELPLILLNELYLGPPPHILPTIQNTCISLSHENDPSFKNSSLMLS